MPYRDEDKARESAKERMRRYRGRNTEGVTEGGVTTSGVTQEIPDREGFLKREVVVIDGEDFVKIDGGLKPRFHILSDGQRWDRGYLPIGHRPERDIGAWKALALAYFTPNMSKEKAKKIGKGIIENQVYDTV